MFDEKTIDEILALAERSGAPPGVANDLEADLKEALHRHRRRMDRINRHTEVLDMLANCGYSVTLAADRLEMSREGVYKHLRKSTETRIGVDAKAA